MRALLLAVLGLALSACAPTPVAQNAPPTVADVPKVAPAPTGSANLSCTFADQGGFVICKTAPGAELTITGGVAASAAEQSKTTRADSHGYAVLGFDRDSADVARIDVRGADFAETLNFGVPARTYSVQAVNGLPQDTVTPSDPALLARIARERDMKNVGFASRADTEGFLDKWIWPVDGVVSGLWGNQRVLNGVPNTPHYGIDIAAPIGTQVRAPAGGVVAFAEPDMHYEGGLVLIDHGQGLISMYLHMSRLDVKVGDVVKQGDPIGAVGMKGRATGPHLCWRLKWRDRYLDPSLLPVINKKPLERGSAVASFAAR